MNGVESVQKNAMSDAQFERKDSKGQFMFSLEATNGQVVGTSEPYQTAGACNGWEPLTCS